METERVNSRDGDRESKLYDGDKSVLVLVMEIERVSSSIGERVC